MIRTVPLLMGLTLALAIQATSAHAATRDEIAQLATSHQGDFNYWQKDSPTVSKLKAYVDQVTDTKANTFVPIENRIAVFDVDGTLIDERGPFYLDWLIFLHRVLHDPTYKAPKNIYDFALRGEKALQKGERFPDYGPGEFEMHMSVFEGMTDAAFAQYVLDFAQTPNPYYTSLKYGEAFFLPMVEIISYLKANHFTVYAVTGSDRAIVRSLVNGLNLMTHNHVIGSDVKLLATGQKEKDGLSYRFSPDDALVRGALVVKNLQQNKVEAIAKEIGQKPILAFGNSNGDASMMQYTINNNPYPAMAFRLMCDDKARTYCRENVEKSKNAAQKYGWETISMTAEWRTIFGEKVKKTKH